MFLDDVRKDHLRGKDQVSVDREHDGTVLLYLDGVVFPLDV
jgi:hypothetical protein